jgi:hypothetical protein
MEITRSDFPRQLFGFSSAAMNAPFAVSRVDRNSINQDKWEPAFVAAC